MTRDPRWTDRYVGLPWRKAGRGPDGFDCWGLVRWVVLQETGVELPLYDEGSAAEESDEIAEFVRGELTRWRSVELADMRLYDIVVFRGKPCHVGLYVGRARFLHVQKGCNAVLGRLDSPHWRPRLQGVVRAKELGQ
jgi:cell wall-associated NlpC family hydrolase